MAEVRASVIRRRTWINSPRKARGSPAGMVRPVARQAAPRSLPGVFRSARHCRSWSRRATRIICSSKRRPSPSSSRRMVTRPTSRANGILGDKPDGYPIEHGFDEMKSFAAYYPGVYTYSDTSEWFHPWFPSYNKAFSDNVLQNCEHVRVGRRRGPACEKGSSTSRGTTSLNSTRTKPHTPSNTSSSTRRMTNPSSWTSTS